MNFFNLWQITRNNSDNQTSFFREFLNSSEESVSTLLNGSEEDLLVFSKLMLNIPIDEFIEQLEFTAFKIKAKDIIQFSNFNHGVIDVNRIIKFNNKPMTFNEIGDEIMHCKLIGACKKYGENHSKLAYQFNLVKIERRECCYVSNTNFGEFSVSFSKNDKIEIIRRLGLRNIFVKRVIFDAINGNCDYKLLTKNILSDSTSERRKSNVKYLIELILKKTQYEYLLNNIVW